MEDTTDIKLPPIEIQDLQLRKKRVGVMERYGLGPVLIKLMYQHGQNSGWEHLALMLEEHVLETFGIEIKIYPSNLNKYYKAIRRGEILDSADDVSDMRRLLSEEWARSAKVFYDMIADVKVLMEHSYNNKNSRDYAMLSTNMTNMLRLLSEIHNNTNNNMLVREKIINLVHIIINIIKEYDFQQLKDVHCNNFVDVGGGKSSLSDAKINDVKRHLLSYIVERLPEVSPLFTSNPTQPSDATATNMKYIK